MSLELLLVEPTKETTEDENITDLTNYIVFLKGLSKDIEAINTTCNDNNKKEEQNESSNLHQSFNRRAS